MFMDKWGHLSKPASSLADPIRPDVPVDDFLKQLSLISRGQRLRRPAKLQGDRRPELLRVR